jgi:hypothetical protein
MEAGDAAAALELDGSAQAVLIVEEPFAEGAVVEALYTDEPDAAYLSRISGYDVKVAPLPDQDWIRLSQEGLPPVRAGRFFVYGAHDQGIVPNNTVNLKIDAGAAFGTGHHGTTVGCLVAFDELLKKERFERVLDVGCGTGVLAIAAAKTTSSPMVAGSGSAAPASQPAMVERFHGIKMVNPAYHAAGTSIRPRRAICAVVSANASSVSRKPSAARNLSESLAVYGAMEAE